MGKTSGGRLDAGVRAHRIANRRDSVVSWGRRGRCAGGRTSGVSAAAGAGAGAGAGAAAWRRRERAPQPRRPMEILTSIYALLSGGGHPRGRIEHLLLDPLDLHCGWRGRCLSRSQERRAVTTTLREVLPMGRVHALLSGNAVLRSSMAMEVMGGRQDKSPNDGLGCGSVHRDREEDEEEVDPRLLVGEFEVPQLVGLPVLPLRVSSPCQCYRANVPDEPLFRRRVHDLWSKGHQIYGIGPRGPLRPYDLHISKDGEMHTIQQVRFVRRGGATRRSLHTALKRSQRKDLRFPLVLVRHPRRSHFHHSYLPSRHHLFASHAGVHDAYAIQTRPSRQHRHDCQTKQDGRLVSSLHPRRELRLGNISGYNARVRKQAEPQLSASHSRCSGRVTSGARVGVPHVTHVTAARHGPTGLSCPDFSKTVV